MEILLTILIIVVGMLGAWGFGYSTGRTKGFQEGFNFKKSAGKKEKKPFNPQ